jgi:hypothetical protein
MHGAPKEIQVKLDSKDDWSEVSGSNKARKHMATGQHKGQEEELKCGAGVLSSNYYKVLQQGDGKENRDDESKAES